LVCALDRAAAECTPESLANINRWSSSGYPKELDVGIYWYGPGDRFEKATENGRSQFYDPAKKTVIYFHGWTGGNGGWTSQCGRISSLCPASVCAKPEPLLDRWFADDWNVGFFYWDQIADEECTRDAEQKVWFDIEGDGLRWKSYDVFSGESTYKPFVQSSDSFTVEVFSVADLCVQSVSTAMPNFHGPVVRFVGHSLGTQLAARCADKLHAHDHPAAPQRVSLLEPFFTQIHAGIFRCSRPTLHESVGDYLPKATASIVKRLWEIRGVVTEVYKSSPLTELTLTPLVGLGHVDHALECKHCAVFPLYFLQYGHPAPPLTAGTRHLGIDPVFKTCPTPASSCSDEEIQRLVQRQNMLGGRQRWEQATGFATVDVSDDTFSLLPDETVDLSKEAHRPDLRHSDKMAMLHGWPMKSAIGTLALGTFVGVVCFFMWQSSRRTRYEPCTNRFDGESDTPGAE